ncbi:hypothetical protein U3516DRAFT_795070 [Neocallimastix sp. 'constans']
MDDQLEISETNKEKNQIIVNRKYKFNLLYITNNIKIFKCTKYKIVKKCKSYIILNDNNKVIKYENKHTHPGKEYDTSVYIKKQLPPDISKFNEIPDKSEYYINERDENYMIYKNSNIIIFQSSFPIPNRIVY